MVVLKSHVQRIFDALFFQTFGNLKEEKRAYLEKLQKISSKPSPAQ